VPVALAPDVDVLVRGWLHGNAVLLRGERPAIIDTGYHTGAEVLFQRIECFVGPVEQLHCIALTHVHSDHCGVVAALQEASDVTVFAHADAAARVEEWTDAGLWLGSSGQELPRFTVDHSLVEGDEMQLGDRTFRVIWTPGHAEGGIAFFDEHDGLLITGDGLWENGFGLLNPWIEGPQVYELAELALSNIAATKARLVIPGHLEPFTDLDAAVGRARSRLAHLAKHPGSMRRAMLKSGAAFYALAHPEVGAQQIYRQVLEQCRVHHRLDGDDSSGTDEDLAQGIVGWLAAQAG